MLWLWLAIASTVLFAIVNIIEKHVMSDELRDSRLGMSIYGVDYFLISLILIAVTNTAIKINSYFFVAISAGIFMGIARWLYYKSLKKEEVSRIAPLYLLSPLFVLVLGVIFLNETFNLEKYVGLFFLITGAITISFKKEYTSKWISWMVVLSALLFGFRDVIARYLSYKLEFFNLFFGISAGVLIVSLVLFTFHHPSISKKRDKIKGVEHLFLVSVAGVLAHLLFLKAVTLQKVALVSALANSKVFLVFILAIILSKYDPKIIREHLEKTTIEFKIAGTILLFAGALLIVL